MTKIDIISGFLGAGSEGGKGRGGKSAGDLKTCRCVRERPGRPDRGGGGCAEPLEDGIQENAVRSFSRAEVFGPENPV